MSFGLMVDRVLIIELLGLEFRSIDHVAIFDFAEVQIQQQNICHELKRFKSDSYRLNKILANLLDVVNSPNDKTMPWESKGSPYPRDKSVAWLPDREWSPRVSWYLLVSEQEAGVW